MKESSSDYKFGFEKLEVWQKSIQLVEYVYKIIDQFPLNENYALGNQLQRAVISVSSNIAEGTSKSSFKDQARYSEIAYGSLMEVLNQLIIANRLKYLSDSDLLEIRQIILILSRQLNALRKTQKERYNERGK